MADRYVSFPIETDPDALAQTSFDYLAAVMPGWVPAPGHLESWIVEAMARLTAEARTTASDVPRSIFRAFGASMVNLPPVDAAPASAESTWTMVDDAGYTIPQGTLVGLRAAGDVLLAFGVAQEVVVPAGQTATPAGAVLLVAEEAGAAGSGLAGPPELIDALAFVGSIALVAATTGGVDAEDDDAYLDRLSRELELLAPRPILPDDFAVLARRIAGVARATALDGYNPVDLSSGNERMVTVALVDAAGAPVSGVTKTAVADYLESLREVNFVVHVVDAGYTTIDVAFTGKVIPGYDPTDTEARVIDALTAYLSPGSWGRPEFGDTTGPSWINEPVVRFLEVASAIDRVEGVRYVSTLTVNGGGVNVNLSGAIALPQPGVISGTLTT